MSIAQAALDWAEVAATADRLNRTDPRAALDLASDWLWQERDSQSSEVIGLTRGLLSAGCSSIVASLWTVSDESTAHLMADFYRQFQSGAEPAVALRAAMLGLRSRYDHPYYWAAFAVIGGGLGRAS
jgi:CHAT domain-containing protein